MDFDPRCVGFEGRLHADGVTLEYVGRGNHDSDAACFRSRRTVAASASSQRLRIFYFETHVLATNSSSAAANNSANLPLNSRHAAHDQDRTATIARDWRRRAELQAMDLEDVQINTSNDRDAENPMHFAFTLSSRTLQQMRTRHERRRLRRSTERKRFSHKVAVGFLLDEVESCSNSSAIPSSFTSFSSSRNGILEARLSRRAVKQLMQRVLPDAPMSGDESEEEQEERREKMAPKICHRDLGMMANSLAYVGSTGRVVSHGREFLQCERYGTGDVVGCGVLLDTNTFFFTLNGRLMGMLEARDVYDLDDFGELAEISDDESSDEVSEDDGVKQENGDINGSIAGGVGVLLNKFEDVDMEEIDGCVDEEKVLYPSISLHGVGECVRAVFGTEELQFDIAGFEQQVQKERQRALLEEREKRGAKENPSDIEQMDFKDEAAMNELVQDFFLHYGYENAYKTFESALTPSKRCRMSSDSMDIENGDGAEANGSCNMNEEEEEKHEDMELSGRHSSLYSPKKQHMRRSLSLRHEVREHIRCFRTTQALNMLEQHTLFTKNGVGNHLRQFRKLLLYCRILCVIDILTREAKASVRTNGSSTLHSPGLISAPTSPKLSSPHDMQSSGWNPEPAIEYARQAFGSSFTEAISNGKRKRQGRVGSSQKKCDDANDVALAMSLLLYDRRESVPVSSRAQKFLTPQFRESVADQLNNLLFIDEALGNSSPRVSSLETFIKDLGDLQKECLHHGCRVYPDSVATVSTGKCSPRQHHHRRSSLSSNSDDSSSSQSQSDQDERLDEDDGGEVGD